MKRKVLCLALALLMCMMVVAPAFADSSSETPPERAMISASFGLKNVSGSTYKMWAIINNPEEVSVSATLTLYDASYNYITSISKTSSNPTISMSKNVVLSSGTYYLRLSVTADGVTNTAEKTYHEYSKIKVPKKDPNEREALTEEQIMMVNQTWDTHFMGYPAMIMLYCGLRRGELLALTWKDVDLEHGFISISKAVEIITNQPRIKKPKSKAGIK